MNRSSMRGWSRLMALVLMCAQLAVSAYACPQLPAPAAVAGLAALSPAATADTAASISAELSSPCMQGMQTMQGHDADAPLLCAEHCKGSMREAQVPALDLPGPSLAALYALYPLVPQQQARPMPALASAGATSPVRAPPHAVLHCVYRI